MTEKSRAGSATKSRAVDATDGAAATRRVADDAAKRTTALKMLRAGGLIAIPTDTVYGLSVALHTAGGIERRSSTALSHSSLTRWISSW